MFLSENSPANLQEYLIVYLVDRSEFKEDKIINLLNSVPYTLKQKVMSAWDTIEKRGFETGSQKTRLDVVKNLIKLAVLSDEQIASVADVSIDFVKNVRIELSLGNS
jgi:hypothetical protein